MRPCVCDRFVPGEPWVLGRDCRLCYLYHNDPRYKALWCGDSPPPVGDAFFLMASLFNIHETKGCPCKSMRLKMNRWGVNGCRDQKNVILNHLQQEAYKRNLPLVRWQLWAAVELAIFTAWLAPKTTASLAKLAIARATKRAENTVKEGE